MSRLIIILMFFGASLCAQVEQSGNKNSGFLNSFDIDVASYPTGEAEKTAFLLISCCLQMVLVLRLASDRLL